MRPFSVLGSDGSLKAVPLGKSRSDEPDLARLEFLTGPKLSEGNPEFACRDRRTPPRRAVGKSVSSRSRHLRQQSGEEAFDVAHPSREQIFETKDSPPNGFSILVSLHGQHPSYRTHTAVAQAAAAKRRRHRPASWRCDPDGRRYRRNKGYGESGRSRAGDHPYHEA